MGFRGKIFDVQILRAVDAGGCSWPVLEERRSETLGGNRAYYDFAQIGWREVKNCLTAEREVICTLETSPSWEDSFDEWSEECEENGFLLGMDLGMNSITAALSASRCLPYYSCNGALLEGGTTTLIR